MKKQLFIALLVAFILIIPVSVYAYSNTNGNTELITSSTQTRPTRYGMMGNFNFMSQMDFDFMTDMMSTDFNNEEEYNEFIAKQKLNLEEKVQNGELTQAEADEYLSDLIQMIQFHKTNYQGSGFNTNSRCH